jgi:flavodoxin
MFVQVLGYGTCSQMVSAASLFIKFKKTSPQHTNMKILIAYYSETGNTEKVARAIQEEVADGHEVRLYAIDEITADDLTDYRLVFFGAPCHSADLAPPIKKFLQTLPLSPKFKLAGFFTHATYAPDEHTAGKEIFLQWAGKCLESFEKPCEEKQIDFLGYFHCMGAPSPPIEEFIRSKVIKSEEELRSYLSEVRTRPDSKDLHNARTFARTILSKL